MFEKWRLVQITKNIEGGEAQDVLAYDTEKEVTDAFYAKCSQYGTNPSVAKCEFMILAPSGKPQRIEQIDNTRY